jgi:hypothetical protein
MNTIEKIELAKTLFFRTDKTQKEICNTVGWSQNTFTRHKTKEKWEEQKEAHLLTKDQLISELMKQAKKISDAASLEKRTLTASEVDSITKLASSIEKLTLKLSFVSIVETGIKVTNWVDLTYGRERAIEFNNLFDEFIKNGLSEK